MLPVKRNKNQTDGNVDQSGEDTNDSGFSDRAPGLDLKEMAKILPTQEEQPKKDEKRDLKMKVSEDSTDAVPSNRPTATVVPQSTLQQQPCNEKVSTRTRPSVISPVTRCKDGARPGVKRNTVELGQAINHEDEKDLILYELADQVAGSCDLRKMALRLRLSESLVAQIEHDNPKLIIQFYKIFQHFYDRMLNREEVFKRLLEILVKTDQGSTAAWLRKRLGIRDLEASLEGEESSPIQDVIPQTETTRGNSNKEFYDIFLVHSGKSENTKKFQKICDRHKWAVKSIVPMGTPVHDDIERMLNTSTHLALIITENDCIKYKNQEMSMTVEMALQLAYNQGTLAGKVLPIRCCNKRSLPLVLQALTGAHIDEESFEERLVETIDTKTRLSRMREKQN